MTNGGVGGSDESFISFLFAIVSVIMILLYLPWAIRNVRKIVAYYTTPSKKRNYSTNPLAEVRESIMYLPRVASVIAADPPMLMAGARFCMKEKYFFFRSVLPRFLGFIFRPRIFMPWLWFVLLSSAMYVTLTFDAHAILGVSQTATTGEIKKAYRALSRRYHPDHNKTEEARQLYVQVRRAYKALVDREAFEEEEARNVQEFSVGIALPRFLTSREHDGLVLFSLLSILIGLPLFLWYRFSGADGVTRLIQTVQSDKIHVERFLKHLGISSDSKFIERRESRRHLTQLLIQLGILPENTDESTVASLPPYSDFITRCVEVDKNMTFLRHFFEETAIQMLHEHMVANGVRLLDEFQEHLDSLIPSGEPESRLVSLSEYRAITYFFQQHLAEVDAALEGILEKMSGSLPSARKLLNLHGEMFDLLRLVFEGDGKQIRGHIQKLMLMPQRTCEMVDAIGPEIHTVYKRVYKNYLEQQMNTKQERRVLKATMRSL
ncbi:putative chaperone protein DNAj [Trypanosoma vivax]|uniref:Putative chaperone protein DNAj n=1 Tax=Trypanosoma vivax (strain Y486) TaxID=1055687 RepID=G0U2W6_TRYVY|nr:putative chaperone protein DNAj [Trypanosoma vivax]CCC50620.1 putative chaperone protein DNAj [Trypanosoma vivax Y486]